MVTNTIAAELLQQINLTKLHPNPNYLSATGAISVDEFKQTEYGLEYTLDTSNIQWGSAPNDSHIFDIFSELRTHRDSMKTRLEMLWFVAENTLRYKWDCHVLFTMHIDTWLKQMSYWGTRADELAIYALSDMLNVHSFVITKNRPWPTVDASVNSTVMEILRLCPVKLVYLGNNNFGRLWPKLIPLKDVSTNQTNTVPVFPDSQPLVTIPAPPTLAELETAQALVTLQKHIGDEPTTMPVPNMNLGKNELLLQEPNVLPVLEITDFPLEAPPWVEAEPLIALTDAMDKIVEHTDISHPEPYHWMKSRDCMDIITGRISELVDTVNLSNLPVFECIKIKPCIVELVHIKNIPTVKLPSLQTKEDLLTLGQYFTRSKLRPKKSRQSASSNIDYEEKSPPSDSEKKPKNK